MPFLLDLPTEVLDNTLSYVKSEGDQQALHACSLACKQLSPIAQNQILYSLTLTQDRQSVCTALEQRPHIRQLIKNLTLRELNLPWIQHGKATQRIIELLASQITSLTVFQHRFLTKSSRFELSSLAALQSVEVVRLLDQSSFPQTLKDSFAIPTFLNQFPKLRALTLRCGVTNIQESHLDMHPPPVFSLEDLYIQWSVDHVALRWLVPATKSLKRLRVALPQLEDGPSFVKVAEKFIAAAATSLEYFALPIDNKHLSRPDIQTLMDTIQKATLLRSLNFIVPATEQNQIEIWVKCFRLLPGHSGLRHLILNHWSMSDIADLTYKGCRDDLEDLLLDSVKFPSLQTVQFRLISPVSPYHHGEAPPLAPLNLYLEAFPRLSERLQISSKSVGEIDAHEFVAGLCSSVGPYLPLR